MISLESAIQDAKTIAANFFSEGRTEVFIAAGHGRLYVGANPAEAFQDYPNEKPKNYRATSLEDIDEIFQDEELQAACSG